MCLLIVRWVLQAVFLWVCMKHAPNIVLGAGKPSMRSVLRMLFQEDMGVMMTKRMTRRPTMASNSRKDMPQMRAEVQMQSGELMRGKQNSCPVSMLMIQ